MLKKDALLDISNTGGEIRCVACRRLLAVSRQGKLEIKTHDRSMRIYGWGVICIDCSRCGRTAEVMLPTGIVSSPQNAS